MKADVLLKYHQILAKRGSADAALYFALQFEGSDWWEVEVLPKNADYLTRSSYEERQKSRQREGMLLANQYFSQALESNDPIIKVRALSGRWRTMFWLAKEFFDRWGTNTNNDDRRRITTEIKTSIEWRIALRAAGFPHNEYWPRRLFEKGIESSILEAERWHFERILMKGNRRYRDRIERFSNIGGVLWALGVIAELGLDGKPAPERAIELYEKALSARCSWASWRLGDMLAASGKTQDARVAYETGAALGHPLSKLKLALCGDEDGPGLASVEFLVAAARAGVGDAWRILRNFLSAQDVEGGLSDTEIETMEKVAIDLCSSRAIRDALKQEKPDQDRYQHNREIDRLWSVLSKSQNAQDCYDTALHYLAVGHDRDNALYLMFSRAARLGSADAQYHLGRFHDPCVSKPGYSYSRDAEASYKHKDPLVAFMWYEKAALCIVLLGGFQRTLRGEDVVELPCRGCLGFTYNQLQGLHIDKGTALDGTQRGRQVDALYRRATHEGIVVNLLNTLFDGHTRQPAAQTEGYWAYLYLVFDAIDGNRAGNNQAATRPIRNTGIVAIT